MRPRVALIRAVLALIVFMAVVYVAGVAYLVYNETAIVFRNDIPMSTLRPTAPFETVELARDDGVRQPLWIMRAAANPGAATWVLFFHGNAGTISARLNILHYERLRQLGMNIVAPEYRGYGGTPGVPTEAGLEEDGRAAYDYLRGTLRVPAERIVVYGWSLGSAVAVDVAAHVPTGAVILEGAPSSLVDVGQLRYPYIPIRLLMRNPFESIRKIGNIRAPLLFLHSPEDAVVPIEEGRRLFEAARPPKQFVEVTGGHVYAAERDPRFFSAVGTFLAGSGLAAASRSAR